MRRRFSPQQRPSRNDGGLEKFAELVVPTIVLGELRVGFRLGARRTWNEKELGAFLRNPVVRVADVDDDCAAIYADIVADLRRAGTPLPANDIWIGALAAREGATVLTYDDDFVRISRVGCLVLGAKRQRSR